MRDLNLRIASNLLLNGCTQTLPSLIKMVFPIYCNFFLKSWHFLGEILNPFLSKAYNKSPKFTMCDFFVWVNNNRSSIITSLYFLLCKQSNIAFIYNYHIDGDIFNPIGILWYRYETLPRYGKIPHNLFEFSEHFME